MGYTHYFSFHAKRGEAKQTEEKYQAAIADCQRIVRRYYAEFGGLAGFTAHTPIGAYGGLQVNGAREESCEPFELREHFGQNTGGFVKTNRHAYDAVVTACLSVLKHRLGDAFRVSSDGTPEDWAEGLEYARKVTRLKLKNPIQAKPQVNRLVAGIVMPVKRRGGAK